MRVHSLLVVLSLLLATVSVSFCSADDSTFEVVGAGECADCKDKSFETSQAFSGLKVTIDCKLKNGDIKRVGSSELDKQGKFKVSLPKEIVENGQKLKEECYAQLHSAASIPCPAHNGVEASKIVFVSTTNNKHTFGPAKPLQFSTPLCTSKFLWPYFKYPPLPTTHPWKKDFPKLHFPPLKDFGHPWYKPKPLPPPVPIYKPPIVKPLPPPVPIYKPPVVVKPLPPVPIYKPIPKPPIVKPLPPPVPIYKPKPPVHLPPKKPCPPIKPKPPVYKPKPQPPVYKPKPKPKPPVYKPKPKPPVYKPKPKPPVIVKPLPPPVPVYKPPVIVKPLPPPFYKKPCPPLPKLPPFPHFPPKYFHHPKFGFFPPLPPSIPQP